MAFSKIVVTFNSIPQLNDVVSIGNSLSANDIFEVFKGSRFGNFQTTIGSSVNDSAFFYQDAITLDYNSTSLYTITLLNNTVTITANQDGVVFTEVTNTSAGRITTVITNEAATPALTIDTVAFSTASSDPCNNVKVTVTTSELATKVTSPVLIDPNVANPFIFDFIRGVTVSIECETATLNAVKSQQLPAILSVATTTIGVISNPTGSTVTVTHSSTFGLNLEYSLDNITFQSSNVFQGVAEGNFTMYIKDQLGCQISTGFSVSIFTPDTSVTTPFTHVAKEQSIRYKKNEVFDNCTIYRTEENTLSCEEKVETAYEYFHKFQTCDTITTQFLSNFETLSANVIKEDGNKDALSVVKRSLFLGAKDKRDARYFNALNNQTGVYFTSGNTYDYTTGFANGTYELNGALPNYGVLGNFIFLDGIGWFQIVDITFDEVRDSDVLIINHIYTGVEAPIIVSSEFNIKNYEVYEYNIDMSLYDNQTIQVELLMSDTDFGTENYLSEKICIVERWFDTLELIWFNPTDTFVFYSTGFKNKARVDFQLFTASDDTELEIHKTDLTTILISSESYETMNLELSEVPTAIKRQLTKAAIHKEFFADGIQYISNSVPESEPINFTNLHVVKMKLTKTGNVFNSEFKGTDTSLGDTELVGLLKTSNKFIKLEG